jgi:hypothetical protein
MFSYSDILRILSAKIRKGQIRATVLGQIKDLEEGIKNLTAGKEIKKDEIKEYRKDDPRKTSILKKQVEILEEGIHHMKEAVSALKPYKKYTTS